MKYKFVCNNKNCKLYDKPEDLKKTMFLSVSSKIAETAVIDRAVCAECGKALKKLRIKE